MSEGITTGTDVIRQKLRVRNKKMNLAILARDLGISSDTLDSLHRRQAIVADPGVAGPDQRTLERTCGVRPRGRPIASSAAGASKATGCAAEPDDPVADLHRRSCTRRPIDPSTLKSPNRSRAGRTPSGKRYEYEGRPTSLPSPVIMASRLPPVTRSSMAGDRCPRRPFGPSPKTCGRISSSTRRPTDCALRCGSPRSPKVSFPCFRSRLPCIGQAPRNKPDRNPSRSDRAMRGRKPDRVGSPVGGDLTEAVPEPKLMGTTTAA